MQLTSYNNRCLSSDYVSYLKNAPHTLLYSNCCPHLVCFVFLSFSWFSFLYSSALKTKWDKKKQHQKNSFKIGHNKRDR